MSDIEAIKARLAKLPEMGQQRKGRTFDEDYDFGPMAEIWAPDLSESIVYIPCEHPGEIPPLLPFIANAPTDIAALIAEVEALRSEALTMRQWAEEAAAAENANARELREARAEVARLRALLGLE